MENNNAVSSVVRVSLFAQLLAKDIRTLAHPAAIHEMNRQLDIAVQDLKVNVMTHTFDAMVFFGVVKPYDGGN
jgi:hypothetical protein